MRLFKMPNRYIGEKRVRKVFALLPTFANDCYFYWLCWMRVEQELYIEIISKTKHRLIWNTTKVEPWHSVEVVAEVEIGKEKKNED